MFNHANLFVSIFAIVVIFSPTTFIPILYHSLSEQTKKYTFAPVLSEFHDLVSGKADNCGNKRVRQN